jgi:hypothetical protein
MDGERLEVDEQPLAAGVEGVEHLEAVVVQGDQRVRAVVGLVGVEPRWHGGRVVEPEEHPERQDQDKERRDGQGPSGHPGPQLPGEPTSARTWARRTTPRPRQAPA